VEAGLSERADGEALMIKLRVEWHHTCPGCGTRLVIDFLDDSANNCVCPWCGCRDGLDRRAEDTGLRDFVARAAKELEEKANDDLTVQN
jgi:phage/plasmid primase-like uncharacterized protein